jgi:hypothetical protein
VFDGALEYFWPIGVTLAEARHEFIERLRVPAVAVPRLWHSTRKPALQRFNHPASNFVLHLEHVFHLEVMFLRKGDLLGHAIEEVHRNAPVCSHLLDIPLQDVADPQIAARVRRVGPSGVVKDCRCRNGSNIRETPEHGNQSICKTK